MSTIIAGRFDTQEHADAGMAALGSAGFTRKDMQSFYISPPGMHGNVPIVDDDQPAVGTRHAGATAAAGAVIGGAVGLAAGIAAAPLVVPAAAAAGVIAGTGVGAYGGSLIGSMQGAGGGEVQRKAERGEPVERRSGILVAVCADTSGEDRAIETLRAAGAQDIERAVGVWNEGEWLDFDPNSRPQLVD